MHWRALISSAALQLITLVAPTQAYNSYKQRFQPPTLAEGFVEVRKENLVEGMCKNGQLVLRE